MNVFYKQRDWNMNQDTAPFSAANSSFCVILIQQTVAYFHSEVKDQSKTQE